MNTVGESLRALRERHGYSLQQVQQISGGKYHASLVGSWERDYRNGGTAKINEYVADLYGWRYAFVPGDVTDGQLAGMLRVLAADVDPDEFAAGLAIARLLKDRAVPVLASLKAVA